VTPKRIRKKLWADNSVESAGVSAQIGLFEDQHARDRIGREQYSQEPAKRFVHACTDIGMFVVPVNVMVSLSVASTQAIDVKVGSHRAVGRPANVASQPVGPVVHDDRGVLKNTVPAIGFVAREVHPAQAGAVLERRISDIGDAVGNGQTGAVIERVIPNVGHAGADRHVGQAGAVIERGFPNLGAAVGNGHTGHHGAVIERVFSYVCHAVRDSVHPAPALWKLDENRLRLVEQDPIQTAVVRIAKCYRKVGQAGAKKERRLPEGGDAIA